MKQDPHLLSSQQDVLVAQKLSAEGVLMNLGMGKPQLDDLPAAGSSPRRLLSAPRPLRARRIILTPTAASRGLTTPRNAT